MTPKVHTDSDENRVSVRDESRDEDLELGLADKIAEPHS